MFFSFLNKEFSSCHCNYLFSHYADFAILPLQIAYYKDSNSKACFEVFGRNFQTNRQVEEFMKRLVYEDSEFFRPEEIKFFCKFRNYLGCHALSDDIIESHRQILQRSIENSTHDSHVIYLLKALDFWVLRSNEKLLEWGSDLKNAFREWEIRTKAHDYNSEDEEEYIGEEGEEENDDDGYFSDGEQ